MATVIIASRGAARVKLVEALGSFLTDAFRSAFRKYSDKAKYLAAVKEGVQAELIALHGDEALKNFIYYAKECYDDEHMELSLIGLSDAKRATIEAYLGALRLH